MDPSPQNPAVAAKHAAALAGLAGNLRRLVDYPHPVLIEGGMYAGVWLECGPLESLVYGQHAAAPEVALAGHDIFFHHQREDGYLPCWIWVEKVGDGQIQQVVPIAATAWETAQLTGDEAFLARAYDACARWDGWLRRHRDTRGTGLVEAFCEYDTGHDRSPRWRGLTRACPDLDARVCPDLPGLPYLAPDLSANAYGARRALATMARALGRPAAEADAWEERAGTIREALLRHCYDPEDEFFYDVRSDNTFNRVRGDVITRVFGEHVVDQSLFERIYARHVKDPAAFWTPYPLPSIAANDPQFDGTLPKNSWGGATQALTALRAPRWFTHYGKHDDLRHLMGRWIEALTRADGFMQQMNPWTGEFSTAPGYSPAMCVFLDFTERLGENVSRG